MDINDGPPVHHPAGKIMDPLAIFIESEGQVALALEKLNRPICNQYPSPCTHDPRHELFTAHELTKQLASRLPELQDLTRAKILMAAYAASQQAIAMACGKLGQLEPYQASKTATNLLSQLQELTKRSEPSQNLNVLIYNQLPDEESRQAWLYITQEKTKQQQISAPKYDWQLPSTKVIDHEQ